MELLQPIGDAIANLQVDATGQKPSNTEALFNLLDKLKTSSSENYETPSSTTTKSRSLLSAVKPSILIALIGAGMMTPTVQIWLSKMFPKAHMKYGVIALFLLVCSVILIKKTG